MENELWMSVYNEDYLIALEYTMPHKSSYLFFYSLQKKPTMMFNLNVRYHNGNVMWSL